MVKAFEGASGKKVSYRIVARLKLCVVMLGVGN
jgi:hypothetical protein